MRFILILLCALFVYNANAELINMDWIVDGNTYTTTTCNVGDDLILPAAPTKYGYTFQGWETYTPLEYIESIGTQYINTKYNPSNLTGVQTKLQILSTTENQAWWFGAGQGSDDSINFEGFYWTYLKFTYYGLAKLQGLAVNTILELDWNKNVINYSINGNDALTYNFSNKTFSVGRSMFLFASNRSSFMKGTKCKMYYFKIYHDDNLVRDFIPARRNSDGAIGMFDRVSGTFFGNDGTGTFIAGPDL